MIKRIPSFKRSNKIVLLAASAALCASLSSAPEPASTQQIILKCIAPLVANSDGTDCIAPAAATAPKTIERLTAFSVRTGDGKVLGLYKKP